MYCNLIRPADRQFRRKCRVAVGLSLMLYLACSQASIRIHDHRLGFVLAGLAGASFFAELISVGLLVIRLRDEFQRILLTQAFVWGTIITMAMTTVWGFVELHGHGAAPHLDVVWVPMVLLCVIAGAKVFIFRQYRPGHA